MFRHGHYADACLLFFPSHSVPSPAQPSSYAATPPLASSQRPDPLATDYGTIDDLCDLCIGNGAMAVLEDIISARIASTASQDMTVSQYIVAALARICTYCETHRHFNYLYKFLVCDDLSDLGKLYHILNYAELELCYCLLSLFGNKLQY